ncbi:hypothetical protein LDENG_00176740 [Lucifuga dentata]|nr:hypothetical protein LDENG_00176740 [Lucifuga dentata]
MQKNKELDQVSPANDNFKFLESFLSLNFTPPEVKDWSKVSVESDLYTVQRAVAKLEMTVTREIKMLCDPDLRKMQLHAINVTLDPDSANLFLTVSDDGKQVKHGDKKRILSIKPERFDNVLNVLAKEGFSSGKFYYEVQVKDKTQWDLGVAKESINRKGDTRLSPRNGYWTIWLRNGSQVSFYDVEARAHIYSFMGCTFTEKLFPFFSPSSNDSGKNSAPLIITPVKCDS